MLPILLLFIIIPMTEIYFLIQVGGAIGAGSTILAVIGTALVGSWLIRGQGLKAMTEFQQSVGKGEVPAQTMFDGVCLLIAGVFLLIPGFVTDAFGFILLVPAFRVVLFKYVSSRKNITMYRANSNYSASDYRGSNGSSNHANNNRTIDVEDYHEVENGQIQDNNHNEHNKK